MKKAVMITLLAIASASLGHGAATALPVSSMTKASAPTLESQIIQVRVKKGSKMSIGKSSHKKLGVHKPGLGKPVKPLHPVAGKPHRPVVGGVHHRWHGRYWSHGRWITGSIVAIGVLTAAAAAAYAPPAPGPGYCWYYSDPSYTVGYWAACQ